MKHIAKRSLSMLLALVMLCSLCVNALAADEVKVNSALSATELGEERLRPDRPGDGGARLRRDRLQL